ncbi:hypothetical protein CS542_04035, partial [Pedobacter sp. IW39]
TIQVYTISRRLLMNITISQDIHPGFDLWNVLRLPCFYSVKRSACLQCLYRFKCKVKAEKGIFYAITPEKVILIDQVQDMLINSSGIGNQE